MMAVTKQEYESVLARAKERSRTQACTLHVNAQVSVREGLPSVVHLVITDWYSSEATVATYSHGE
jgi:hypothetical protein